MKEFLRRNLRPIIYVAIGALIYAISFCWCYDVNQIGFGGVVGIAQIINRFAPSIPIGMLTLAFNIPLFLLGWRLIGRRFLVTSLFATLLGSLLIDGINMIFTFPPMDLILASVFGGVLLGLSLGIIFLEGGSTGGTGLAGRLVKLVCPWLPLGKLLLIIDFFVVTLVAIAFQNIGSALYGLISLYISSMVMDAVLYGMNSANVAYIISAHPEKVGRAIIDDVARGVTILHGKGAYSGNEKEVLMVAFKRRQIIDIKRTVKDIDPDAFLIVCEAHEVLGDGFLSYKKNAL